MENFTPLSASIGGALIGLSAVMLMTLNGRIAGVSSVFSGTVFAERGDRVWRVFFVGGLLAGPIAHWALSGSRPEFSMPVSLPILVVSGLLVGFGTRLGSGCTSGHGVCGLSRLSPRSLAAVGLFMSAGVVTTALFRHALGG